MKQILPDYIGNEVWDFGEDGDCACSAKYTLHGAYLKFRKHLIDDCGMYELDVKDFLNEDSLQTKYLLPAQYTKWAQSEKDDNGMPMYDDEYLYYVLDDDLEKHPFAQKVWYYSV